MPMQKNKTNRVLQDVTAVSYIIFSSSLTDQTADNLGEESIPILKPKKRPPLELGAPLQTLKGEEYSPFGGGKEEVL